MANLLLSDGIDRQKKMTPIEKQRQQTTDWINEQLKHCAYLEDDKWNPSNLLKQMGRTMTHQELEKRLEKIVPRNVIFIDNQYRAHKKAVVLLTCTGPQTICPYDRGLMPEHSVLRVKVEEEPDPDFLNKPGNRVERSDLGKYEWDSQRREYVFDSTVTRPGFRKVKKCYGEDPEGGRGWRTILIRLVESGLASVAAIEREFGSDNSPAWAAHLGKRQGIYLPWG